MRRVVSLPGTSRRRAISITRFTMLDSSVTTMVLLFAWPVMVPDALSTGRRRLTIWSAGTYSTLMMATWTCPLRG